MDTLVRRLDSLSQQWLIQAIQPMPSVEAMPDNTQRNNAYNIQREH